ncbi:MAG: dihydroorotase [Lachnospiraceae bacterium]|nr:dihydroorotase [Candidatus Colinaster scatohippi]
MIVLKNGLVVDPDSNYSDYADVVIIGEKIAMIEKNIDIQKLEEETAEKAEILDCNGCIIGPGLVDVHVHFRDPGFTYKEDIYTGAKAAARGGVTSVVLMANTKPVVDNVETLEYVLNKGKETDIHIYSCASITKGLKGEEIVDMQELLMKGAAGFTDDGIPILDEEMVRRVMHEAAKTSSVLSFHEENPAYITNNGINNGIGSGYFGVEGSDRLAEITMVERDLKLALETGAVVNFQHISTKEAVEAIRRAKSLPEGKNIHAEATPHHMSMTEEDLQSYVTLAKMNPPLRTAEDREAITQGIVDGTMDIIATDHAPHSDEEKGKKITEAPSGIIGLETSMAVSYNTLVRTGKMDIVQLFCRMSKNPAEMYKINAGKLAIDRTADIVIFDPNKDHLYDTTYSKSFNSPLKKSLITGDVVVTISSGRIIYKNL